MLEIQSLSVCVPGGCPNKCKFCVSRMHGSPYPNLIETHVERRDRYEKDFLLRLQFARDNGCNTVILTGTGEPLSNKDFLRNFAHWNSIIQTPFRWIELQTSGVYLDQDYLTFLRYTIGVTTISLSLSDMFDSRNNQAINGTPEDLTFEIEELCNNIKEDGFNLRLSLNMTDAYDQRLGSCSNTGVWREIIARAKKLGADQITFRKLYAPDDNKYVQSEWIRNHATSDRLMDIIYGAILRGRKLEELPFGATRYSVDGISTVVDNDCMNIEAKKVMKYLILRPNCHLYTRWDDTGSLLF